MATSMRTFFSGSDWERTDLIKGATNFLLEKEVTEQNREEKERSVYVFKKQAMILTQTLSLCSSVVDRKTRWEAAFMGAVRTLLVRLTNEGGGKALSLPELNRQVNELLKASVKSDKVINLFQDRSEEVSLFDEKFLEELSKMKEKNLALALLKKLLEEQIQIYRRTNLVKAEKFSVLLQKKVFAYINGMITSTETIEETIIIAKEMMKAHKMGEDLGLTTEELAFYDALTRPKAIKDFYENEQLIALTKELTDSLRRNKTVDWRNKATSRAKMRMMIKKLLAKYDYPPEGQEEAMNTVMEQCNLWVDQVM